MKSFFVSVFVFAIQFLPLTSKAEHRYDRPWETLACHDVYIQDADDFIRYFQSRINAASEYQERCGGGGGECIKFLMDKGYGPSTARETCEGVNPLEFRCLQYLMKRGYAPSTSKTYCDGIPTENVFACMKDLIERGYAPSTARETCYR